MLGFVKPSGRPPVALVLATTWERMRLTSQRASVDSAKSSRNDNGYSGDVQDVQRSLCCSPCETAGSRSVGIGSQANYAIISFTFLVPVPKQKWEPRLHGASPYATCPTTTLSDSSRCARVARLETAEQVAPAWVGTGCPRLRMPGFAMLLGSPTANRALRMRLDSSAADTAAEARRTTPKLRRRLGCSGRIR